MKKLLISFFLFFLLLLGEPRASYSGLNALDTPIPGIFVPGQSKTEFKVCQIRRLFCGKVALAIIATAIFILGVMVLNNKLHWSVLLLTVIGILVFYNADDVVNLFGRANSWRIGNGSTFLLNPTCSCACDVSFKWFNVASWFDGTNQCAP